MVARLLFEVNYEFINRSSSIGLNYLKITIIIILITARGFIQHFHSSSKYIIKQVAFFFFLIDRHLMSMAPILTPRTRGLVAGMTPHQAGLATV